MTYSKPSCNSFAGIDMADISGTVQTAYLHVFFEQVAELNDKSAQATVQIAQSYKTETIHTIKDLA